MTFAAPQFFLLLALLFLLGWFFRRLELWRPLRILLLFLLVAALADPLLVKRGKGLDLWVLIDRSLSADGMVSQNEREWRTLLERSRPTAKDTIHFVDYAGEVVTKANAETATYPGNRSLTRTGLAIQDVLARVDQEKHSRLLVFTDGYSTEPLTGVSEKLITMEVPLDFRELRAEDSIDYRVMDFDMPGRIQIGEPFIVDIQLAGSPTAKVPMAIYRGETQVLSREVEVENGLGRFRFSDRIVKPGAHRYRVEITPENDAFPGNNSYETWIEVTAGPRILLISKYTDDPVAAILRAQGFDVVIADDPLSLSPGSLTGARAVILNNIPAWEFPNDFLEALTFFVKEQGGGLMMAGGKFSFGSGGFFESAVDPLLPVSMELKSEHRKLAVAMAIVMDRSGSMGMTVTSGHTKMDLANEGAARAVELLGAMDAVTVYAVDSQAHEIAPLLNVGKSRGELIDRIRTIESMGGGIFVFTGLEAAWKSLETSSSGQRHIILFSDAQDSEEPGKYKQLIAEMRKENATISVIGLGKRGDVDAPFLEDIATRGDGRIFFTTDPGNVPSIFAQETVSVARSTFVEEPVSTQATGAWYELSNKEMKWLGEIDGYNLSYTRDGDDASLLSKDAYTAPLVASGRRGIGRTAAVSFPLGGEFSEKTRNWEDVGDFVQTLSRWLMGEDLPPGIGLRHHLSGTELTIDLLFEEEPWQQTFALKAPRLVLNRGEGDGKTDEVTWNRLAPGHYSVKVDLKEGELIRGAVQVGGAAIPFGPVVVGTSSEWAFDNDRVDELRETARASGGRELVDLEDAWEKPPATGFHSIRNWLLWAALITFILEALITRTGWRMPLWTKPDLTRKPKKKKTPKAKPEKKEEEPEPDPEPVVATPDEQEETNRKKRRSRFDRAKKRR